MFITSGCDIYQIRGSRFYMLSNETETLSEADAEPALFGALPAESRADLAAQAVRHRMAGGTILFEQGETPAFQYIVLSGAVQLLGGGWDGKEALIDVVESGDLITPAAAIMGVP